LFWTYFEDLSRFRANPYIKYFTGWGVFIVNTCNSDISGMDNVFFKSVYCLSGLGTVRKNRRIP